MTPSWRGVLTRWSAGPVLNAIRRPETRCGLFRGIADCSLTFLFLTPPAGYFAALRQVFYQTLGV